MLHLIDVGEHRIEECAACGGVFVEQTTLSRLVRERAVESEATVVERPRTQRDKAAAEATYRACPQCQKVMMRKKRQKTIVKKTRQRSQIKVQARM